MEVKVPKNPTALAVGVSVILFALSILIFMLKKIFDNKKVDSENVA